MAPSEAGGSTWGATAPRPSTRHYSVRGSPFLLARMPNAGKVLRRHPRGSVHPPAPRVGHRRPQPRADRRRVWPRSPPARVRAKHLRGRRSIRIRNALRVRLPGVRPGSRLASVWSGRHQQRLLQTTAPPGNVAIEEVIPDKSSKAAGQVLEPDGPHKSLYVLGRHLKTKSLVTGLRAVSTPDLPSKPVCRRKLAGGFDSRPPPLAGAFD